MRKGSEETIPGEFSCGVTGNRSDLYEVADHELIRCIGRGSYGEVWLARNRTVGVWRAVKVVRRLPGHEHIFDRELTGIRRFEPISRSHPGLVQVLHVGQGEGGIHYVMELADDASLTAGEGDEPAASPRGPGAERGGLDPATYRPRTLQADLQRFRRFPARRCAEIGRALAEALAHLHSRELLHRDIKPSNVIMVEGAVKLADIGLVSSIEEAGSIVGTEGYLPPEGPGTPAADLFSLGKVLYEIATGCDRRLFPKLPDGFREFTDRRELLELNAVIARACAPNPRKRYPSAMAMRDDLDRLVRGVSIRRRHARRRKAMMVLAIAFACVGSFVATREPAPRRMSEVENSAARAAVLRGFRPEERADWAREMIPPRDPGATARQIDLSAFYNGSLTMAFHPAVSDAEAMGNHPESLPRGLQVMGGVPLDIRGVIQLTGQAVEQRIANLVPRQVRRIPVNLKSGGLHFLHGTAWGDPEGTEVGRYVVRYADGRKITVPLRYGADTWSWWLINGNNVPELGAARAVWRGTNEWLEKNNAFQVLFLKSWENPHPNVTIASIDFESALAFSAPFLIAISAD